MQLGLGLGMPLWTRRGVATGPPSRAAQLATMQTKMGYSGVPQGTFRQQRMYGQSRLVPRESLPEYFTMANARTESETENNESILSNKNRSGSS